MANRYGYIEDGYDKSVTELEFDHAGARGLERLCFVADEGAELPKYPEDQIKLAALKDRIGKLIRKYFRHPLIQVQALRQRTQMAVSTAGHGASRTPCFEPLFVDYARFGGRADVIDRVKTFIDSPEAGHLVITGPAGYGKTALAVKLVEDCQSRPITFLPLFTAQHHIPYFRQSKFFLKNVVEQMRLWNFFPYDTWEAPTT